MLIGITGCKGSGKDTAASFLVNEYGYTKIGFADKLKEAVANLFDITVAEVEYWKLTGNMDVKIERPGYGELSIPHIRLSWREFLQRFGTEMGRNTFGEGFWIERWWDQVDSLAEKDQFDIVIPDVRFKNEADAIHSSGDGVIIEIVRPGHEPDGHESESPLPESMIDARVINDGDIEFLRKQFLGVALA